MRKNYALKYITVASIIAAVVRLIFGFMMINFFSTSITLGAATPEIMRIAVWAIVFVMLNMVSQLVAGFIGAANWEEPERAPLCFICGIISLVFGIVANILQISCGYGASIYAWITGVGVPALYTIAALIFLIFRPKKTRPAKQN